MSTSPIKALYSDLSNQVKMQILSPEIASLGSRLVMFLLRLHIQYPHEFDALVFAMSATVVFSPQNFVIAEATGASASNKWLKC